MEAPAPPRADAFLGLGSNVGNRPRQLRRGISGLRETGVRTVGVSSLYLTEPVDADGHPWYVNCVVAVADPPDPSDLLELCMEVERRCGRRREARVADRDRHSGPPGVTGETGPARGRRAADGNGGPRPRTLDLDLLLYGEETRRDRRLILPHPGLHRRRFVLLPLTELDPEAWHPERGASAREMLEALPPGDGVWLLAPPPRLEAR